MDEGSDGLMNVICSVKKKTPEGENAKIYTEPRSLPRNICTGQVLLENNSDDSIDVTATRSSQQMLEQEHLDCVSYWSCELKFLSRQEKRTNCI